VIVRTTNRQRERTWQLIERANPPQLAALDRWWNMDFTQASKHRVDTVMPYIAWELVEAILFAHCFNQRGFRSKDVKSTDLAALKAIRRSLNARETHPALYKRGAIGYINELIPAWKTPGPDEQGRWYKPRPVQAGEFVILAPETRTVDLKTTTLWAEVAGRIPRLQVLDESEHLIFVR
jgi:hypothetical protein